MTKLELPPAGEIRVLLDTRPDGPIDLSFSAGGGLTPTDFLLDDDPVSLTPTNDMTFGAVPGTYSISTQNTPFGWIFSPAGCDDGSSTNSIELSAGELVTCTFIATPNSYPRPGGATPLRVPLVPAYRVCQPANANSEHVAPLDEPACSPPIRASNVLTTSSIGRGSGFARFDVAVGNPTTPPDEADVRVSTVATDVRNAATARFTRGV